MPLRRFASPEERHHHEHHHRDSTTHEQLDWDIHEIPFPYQTTSTLASRAACPLPERLEHPETLNVQAVA